MVRGGDLECLWVWWAGDGRTNTYCFRRQGILLARLLSGVLVEVLYIVPCHKNTVYFEHMFRLGLDGEESGFEKAPSRFVRVPFRYRFSVRGLWACQVLIIRVPKPIPQRLENLPSTSERGPISSYASKLLNKNET